MWRAFFLAVGTMLIILGLQCLVVDQFTVSQEGKLAKLANKVVDIIEAPPEKPAAGGDVNFPLADRGGVQSPYGPSRFQDPFAPSAGTAGGSNPTFGLAGFRNGNDAAAGPKKVRKTRKVPTRDWMPWSLLAAGTIVVLYTKSSSLGESLGYTSQD